MGGTNKQSSSYPAVTKQAQAVVIILSPSIYNNYKYASLNNGDTF